jgi:hypothetical protein
MSDESIVLQPSNSGLKNFIIGKMWVSSQNGSRPGAIRIDRDLPQDIILKAGTTLFLRTNTKRPGKVDADYSVTVLLPTAVTDELIAETNARRKARVAQLAQNS